MKKEKFVRITRNVLKDTFAECNAKYFEGKLTTPEMFELWTPSKYIAGWIRGVWIPKERNWKTALHISNMFRWTKENLRDTMVHEMIHLEIQDYMRPYGWWHRLFRIDHDEQFRDRMCEINKQFGLNVMVRSKHLRAYMIKPNNK